MDNRSEVREFLASRRARITPARAGLTAFGGNTHNVHLHNTGTKRLHHPIAGDLVLSFEVMKMPADPGLSMAVYTAEPGSPTEEALRFLSSWADTNDLEPQSDRSRNTTQRGTTP